MYILQESEDVELPDIDVDGESEAPSADDEPDELDDDVEVRSFPL